MKVVKSFNKNDIGQNLVELVVVLPLLVLLILGIMQLGLYWRTFQTVESVALEGSNVAASTIDNYATEDGTTATNEPVMAAIDAINSRMAMAGLPQVAAADVVPVSGTSPNCLYQNAAVVNPRDVQITIDYRNPTANGVVVQVVYGYRPILAGTRIPVPGGSPINIIPSFIEVSSSQIQQYNTY